MELNLKKLLPFGLIVLAVMFLMKMMKCEGFTQQKAPKVSCNCNIKNRPNIENFMAKKNDGEKCGSGNDRVCKGGKCHEGICKRSFCEEIDLGNNKYDRPRHCTHLTGTNTHAPEKCEGNPSLYCKACLGFMKKTVGENEELTLEKCGKCCKKTGLAEAVLEKMYYNVTPKANCTDDEDGVFDCAGGLSNL
tara:strand:- start:69 stop:641 length:573 start_codon:yes stop_codon:yes gene_type:complete